MKNCRECGILLPPKKINKDQEYIAKKNIEHFTKYLKEEGDYIPINTKRNIDKIMHESQLWLAGEYTWEEALCENCKKKSY